MVPGVARIFVITRVFAALDPHALFAMTEIFPTVNNALLILTTMELVFDVPVIPVGSDHV
jgi:hypothetical protein